MCLVHCLTLGPTPLIFVLGYYCHRAFAYMSQIPTQCRKFMALTKISVDVLFLIVEALEDHPEPLHPFDPISTGISSHLANLRLSSKWIATVTRAFVLEIYGRDRWLPLTQAGIDTIRKGDRAQSLYALQKITFSGESLRTWHDDESDGQKGWGTCPQEVSSLLTDGTWTEVLKSVSPLLTGLQEVVLQSYDVLDWLHQGPDRTHTTRLWHTSVSCVLSGLLPNLDKLTTLSIAKRLKWATDERPVFLPMSLVHTVFDNGSTYSALTTLHLGFELEASFPFAVFDHKNGKPTLSSSLPAFRRY
jgi:hypothetical protein